ncbi:MAG: DNA-binding domain-containing protein [Rhodospirillaceae bacterium]|nr:DNA-binding domain-containing protein [Rhodospirillaceae bacterium]
MNCPSRSAHVLLELQQTFRATVLSEDDVIARHVRATRGPISRRIGVYRNNVQASLIEVLAAAYPVAQRIVGKRFFHALAREFVVRHVPHVPQLSLYGASFADFVASHDKTQALPYLPDVARLEWARGEAYFAADAPPLDPATLSTIEPACIGDVKLRVHPATRLISSSFPIHRIWTVNQPDVTEVPAVDMTVSESVLISRPRYHVGVRLISLADAAFLRACMAGQTMAQSADAAMEMESTFDLQGALQQHFLGGSFTALELPSA